MTSATIGKKKSLQREAEDSRPYRNEGMVIHVQAEVRRPLGDEDSDSDSDSDSAYDSKLHLEARSKARSVSTSS